jgi:hypothetical protein
MNIPPYSNVNNWNFSVPAPSLSAPHLPDPIYPEWEQDPNLEGLWANLTRTLPDPSPFLHEAEPQTADVPIPAAKAPAADACLTHNLPHAPAVNDTFVDIDIKHFFDHFDPKECFFFQMYKSLAKNFLKFWNLPEHNELLVNAFIAGKGIWGFDLNPGNHLKLLRQPLEGYLSPGGPVSDEQLARAITRDIIEFFHFFDSSRSPLNNCNRLTNFLPQNPPPEFFQGELLGPNENFCAAQAFLNLKIREFKGRIENLKYCLLVKEKVVPYSIPCYLVSRDLKGIHVQIMEAHFNQENSLVKLSVATDAARHLLQTIAPKTEILTTIAQITLEDLQNLQQAILPATANKPYALILRRQPTVDPLDGNKRRKSEDNNQNQPRKRQHVENNNPPANPSRPPSLLPLSLRPSPQVRTFSPAPIQPSPQIRTFSSAPIRPSPQVRTFSPAPIPIQTLPLDEIPLNRYVTIPLAEPDWSKQEQSYDKAFKIGLAFLNQRNQTGNGNDLEILPEKYRTECFVYTNTGSIKLDSISNYSEQLILRLVKQKRQKAHGNGETYEHYDPVILNDV